MACHSRRGFLPALDSLDSRLLLTAQLTASLSRGVLTIVGTDAADVITVNEQGPTRGNRTGSVSVDGLSKVYRATQVKRIDIFAGGGDDVISVQKHGKIAIPARIDGGAGNDTINGIPEANLTVTVTVGPPVVTTPSPTPTLSAVEQRIVDLTNAERQKAGLAPLAVSGPLVQAAQIQSGNMARLDILSHSLPGTAQPELPDRAAAVGYRWSALGENIAFNYADADAVVAGWMASPGHRANILSASYTEIGVSVASDANGMPYYTQDFGRPA